MTDKLVKLEKYGITKESKIIEKLNISIGRYYLTLYQEVTNALVNFMDGYLRLCKNQILGIRFIANLKLNPP